VDHFELKVPRGAKKKRKVLGRGQGSGRGGTSGRGHKGQNSRSGGGVRPGFEGGQMPLYRRIARRGFSNARFRRDYAIVNLGALENKYEIGENVDRVSLYKRGLIGKKSVRVKILGDGSLTKKLKFDVDKLSKSAVEKITGLGGEIAGKAASVAEDLKKKRAAKPKAEKPKAEKPKAEKPKAEKPKDEKNGN
jgi:large subunit ribosomal protein L15